MKFLAGFIVSFLIVALGQPARVGLLCPVASAIGYGIFWIACLQLAKKSSRLVVAFFWFFLVQAVQLSWMVSFKYQGIYIVFVYIFIVALLALQFLFLSYLLFGNNDSSHPKSLFIAAVATLLEWSRLFFFSGFGFNFSGLALSYHISSLQFASVFGVLGLSFCVWHANVFFYACFKGRGLTRKVFTYLIIIAFPYLYGSLSQIIDNALFKNGESINVLLVQPGFSPAQKIYMKKFSREFMTIDRQWDSIISNVSSYSNQEVDLIVLPESFVPYGFRLCLYPLTSIEVVLNKYFPDVRECFPDLKAPYAIKEESGWMVSNSFVLQTLANVMNAEIVAGLDDFDSVSGQYYNAAFCLKPFSDQYERYEKQVLLPLAEALPWKFLKKFTKCYGISEFFTAGKSSKVIGRKGLGVNVCIEETIPEVVRAFKLNGAKMLVSISNDGWYPKTILPLQHFFHGRLRAVENGLPLIRSCNTGVTTAVNAFGDYRLSLRSEDCNSVAESGADLKKVRLVYKKTLYSLWGDSAIVVISLFIVLFSSVYRSRKFIL